MPKLACEAVSWYNGVLNMVVAWSAGNTTKPRYKESACTMDDILRSNTPQKQCHKCKQWKPAIPEFFYRYQRNKDGLNNSCIACEYPARKPPKEAVPKGMKRCCGECKQLFPATLEHFHQAKRNKDGLYGQCKRCKNELGKEHYYRPEIHQRRLDQIRVYRKRPEVRAHINARTRVYYQDYGKRPSVQARTHEYNQDYYYRPDVHERLLAYARAYGLSPKGRENRRACRTARYARKQAVPGTHTAAQIQDLLKRQRYRCYYCSQHFEKHKGKYVYHIDHTFPLSRVVGTDIPANDISYLVLACPFCNMSKHDKFPWEWAKGGKLL